ncbi:hypothetical protein JKP88DRAFT_221378 [Tribonema minus]|uniref:Secreted protein n=1 Tax=Tribonema minus TaxID=303371 RepID=A0A835Z4U0_9STRA|nr:hypothetical protein JKP88DRAFT_221378 [Tribonema minus]
MSPSLAVCISVGVFMHATTGTQTTPAPPQCLYCRTTCYAMVVCLALHSLCAKGGIKGSMYSVCVWKGKCRRVPCGPWLRPVKMPLSERCSLTPTKVCPPAM